MEANGMWGRLFGLGGFYIELHEEDFPD